MSDNRLKTPLIRTLPEFTARRIVSAIQATGRALPVVVAAIPQSGFVTVSFEVTSAYVLPQVTVPIAAFEYIRYPVKIGTRGGVIAFDARLDLAIGNGGAPPTLDQPANLTAIAFVPLGNTAWISVDPTALVLYATPACLLQVTATGVKVTGSAGGLTTQGPLAAGNGASGVFTSQDGKTITVVSGIITSIT